jgi:catechol 2,3-dioxygenase-like lactoylglutathione lyase family enzyme
MDYAVHPSLATADIRKARDWYRDRLGFEPAFELPGLLAYQVESSMFTLFETPKARTAQNTVAIWGVDDVRVEVARLRARGLTFENVDMGPDERTVDGIMTTTIGDLGTALNAWFRDGDGNWVSIVEQTDHPGEPRGGNGWFASLAASDLHRATAWYEQKLGLTPLHALDDEVVYWQGATRFSIFETLSSGTAKNTVAVWRVGDLRSEVAELRARGVVFNDYDCGDGRTIDGVLTDPDDGTLEAWFTDSEGNILGIVEDHPTPIRPV